MYNPYFNAFSNYNSSYINPVSAGQGFNGQPYKQEITEVYGLQGAQTYQMPPNSSCMLLDASEPITYIKKTDGAGSASIIAYKLVPLQTDNNDLEKRIRKLEEIVNESYTSKSSEQPRESAQQNITN